MRVRCRPHTSVGLRHGPPCATQVREGTYVTLFGGLELPGGKRHGVAEKVVATSKITIPPEWRRIVRKEYVLTSDGFIITR